ncbi:hypothetical protein FI667_g15002, partial [Globisporangium splendens]
MDDGFLALTRVDGRRHESLVHGAMDASSDVLKRPKYQHVALNWTNVEAEQQPLFTLPLGNGGLDGEEDRMKIELLLFALLRSQQHIQTNPVALKQRIAFVGRSELQLTAQDVRVLQSSHEIVFSTKLNGDLGSVDIKVTTREHGAKEENEAGEGSETATGGAFSVNWSSSEALKKDLEEKARVKDESDKKLRRQLHAIVAKHEQKMRARDEAPRRQRRWWAAARIQRAFRALLNARKAELERIQQERRVLLVDKKARLLTRSRSNSPKQRDGAQRSSSRSHHHNESEMMAELIEQRQAAERVKLQRRLAQLEAKRRAQTSSSSHTEGSQCRRSASTRGRHEDDKGECPATHVSVLEHDLVRTICMLHLNTTR